MGDVGAAAREQESEVLEQRMETDAKTGAMKGVSLDRYDLIPPTALEYLALIYGKGSLKYVDRNWEKGYRWGLSFRALMKHAWAAWRVFQSRILTPWALQGLSAVTGACRRSARRLA